MDLAEASKQAEQSLLAHLRSVQAAVNDATGKGSEAESVVEKRLVLPNLPPGFCATKGAVVEATNPRKQSGAIDRVIHQPAAAPPLVPLESHSIFPIEAVAGLVEITMHLDAAKLRNDIEIMAPIKKMRLRNQLMPVLGTASEVVAVRRISLSPRSFIVGLPADPRWPAESIGKALRRIQLELGDQTHVHGLYVIGVGFFATIPIESASDEKYRIRYWTGPDRLFRFSRNFRLAYERWQVDPFPANLDEYLPGQPTGTIDS